MKNQKKILNLIKQALIEDVGPGDITSRLIVPAQKKIKAVILAKQPGIVCGLNLARLVFQAVDPKIRFRIRVAEGRRVKAGKVVARLEGKARSIFKAERVALNFLGRLSGIATLTAKYVQKVKPYPVKIMDTRKTTPGLRVLEKYAVRCGGGVNHRSSLAEHILIKDNHLASVGLKAVLKKIKQAKGKRVKVEIEVKNIRQFKQVQQVKPDLIMLDNFSLRDIRRAVGLSKQKIEVSGGVNLANVRRIAACGVEMISVGELTHSAKAQDFALNCE